jgi:4-diphosphocytidyl-2-C-methyl-D-erythritol kinase
MKIKSKNHMSLKANAKINLGLSVLGKRDDGYHELRTVMQTLLLYDDIFLKKIEAPKIKITCNASWLPTNEKNLAYKAANLLRERYNIKTGLYIDIVKKIPVAAGLGGGSANCASVLIGMRNLYNLNISNEKLQQLGKELGADVPYLIMQGTVQAHGIGEKLSPLPAHPRVHVLLAKPKFSVSTADIFNTLSKYPLVDNRQKLRNLTVAIAKKDLLGIAQNVFNDLEVVTATKYPIIHDIKKVMISNGAMCSMMSGSGPTVFGYFNDRKDAIQASKALKALNIKEVILTGTFNRAKK